MSNTKKAFHKHLPPRWDVENAWYFVTVVTKQRYPYFISEDKCQELMNACRTVRTKRPYRLGALMILPDHWHALIRPHKNETIESIVGSIKQRLFHATQKSSERPVLWQSRFMDHRIREEKDYFQHIEYMRLNPAKHRYVQDENAPWPWWCMHKNPFN